MAIEHLANFPGKLFHKPQIWEQSHVVETAEGGGDLLIIVVEGNQKNWYLTVVQTYAVDKGDRTFDLLTPLFILRFP